MRSIAILDAGPLLASLDRRDPDHLRSAEVLRRRDLELVIPTLVIAEVAHFAASRLGPSGETAFLRGLSAFEVEAPTLEDWPLIADLVERYGDFPLGTVDASIAVLPTGSTRTWSSPSTGATLVRSAHRRADPFGSCRNRTRSTRTWRRTRRAQVRIVSRRRKTGIPAA